MIHKLLISHGQLAAHIVHAARRINAEALPEFSVVCLEWDVTLEEAKVQVAEHLQALEEDSPVLILADLFGATPSNACRPYLVPGRVEMVTGVNLPMILLLGNLQDEPASVTALAAWLREKTARGIVHLDGKSANPCPPDRAGS